MQMHRIFNGTYVKSKIKKKILYLYIYFYILCNTMEEKMLFWHRVSNKMNHKLKFQKWIIRLTWHFQYGVSRENVETLHCKIWLSHVLKKKISVLTSFLEEFYKTKSFIELCGVSCIRWEFRKQISFSSFNYHLFK